MRLIAMQSIFGMKISSMKNLEVADEDSMDLSKNMDKDVAILCQTIIEREA